MNALAKAETLQIAPVNNMIGAIQIPADKSITHRVLMLASIAKTASKIKNPSLCDDCLVTISCLKQLGVKFKKLESDDLLIIPPAQFNQPDQPLNCKSSATTMRLLTGLLASKNIEVTLTGSAQLKRRPMKRIVDPLRLMGAHIDGDYPPITLKGGNLKGIHYESPVASAQIKSCILLANLGSDISSKYSEPYLSRDHTERLIKYLSSFTGKGFEYEIPGDFSSAAYWIIAALVIKNARIALCDVGINPTRTGVLDILIQAGAPYQLTNYHEKYGEPCADIEIVNFNKPYNFFNIAPEIVPRLIDEIPILGVFATQCIGTSRFKGLNELKVKECDRLLKTAEMLKKMGANVKLFRDGLDITGPTMLKGAKIDIGSDHRMAMAAAIAGLISEGETRIDGAQCIKKVTQNSDTTYGNSVINKLVIAIDGPAGAGKSTVAKAISKKLGLRYLDTGAMYRALGLKVFRKKIVVEDVQSMIEVCNNTEIAFGEGDPQPVFLDGENVTIPIRLPEIGDFSSTISAHAEVRSLVVAIQKKIIARGRVILEGRDTTTVVAADAPIKIFLTANLDTRANRRFLELQQKGNEITFDQVKEQISLRDYRDTTRKASPLMLAEGAQKIDSEKLTVEQVVFEIEELVKIWKQSC